MLQLFDHIHNDNSKYMLQLFDHINNDTGGLNHMLQLLTTSTNIIELIHFIHMAQSMMFFVSTDQYMHKGKKS